MENTIIKVDGMSCSHCENAVKNAVSSLEGVAEVSVSLDEKTVSVKFDNTKVSLDQIKNEIEEQGYDVV